MRRLCSVGILVAVFWGACTDQGAVVGSAGPKGDQGASGSQGPQGVPGGVPAFAITGLVSPSNPLDATHNFNSFNVVASAYLTHDNGQTYTLIPAGPNLISSLGS